MPTGSKAASRSPLQADAMLTHAALVSLAMRYLDAKGFKIILAEPGFRKERPDTIGFSSGFSCLVECKATRKDFLKDQDKPFRKDPAKGVGTVRIYLTNPGVCTPDEVPDRWMLLEAADEDTIIVRKGDRSCLEGGCLQMSLGWYFPEKDHEAEADLLYSWAWRKLEGCLKDIPARKRKLQVLETTAKC